MVQLDAVVFSVAICAFIFSFLSLLASIYAVATIWAWQKREVQVLPIPQAGQTSGLEKLEELLQDQAKVHETALRDVGFEPEDLV